MHKNRQVIGTTEHILLPDFSEQYILAKVDTGADGSSIWASQISEESGRLSFVLFDTQSAYYTGEKIVADKYSVVNVKNSFGEKEYRFKVQLTIKIGVKMYKASFTLADRSRSRYPILLGKRFLKNRFIVDVSGHNLIAKQPSYDTNQIVILTSRTDQSTKDFFAQVDSNLDENIELVKFKQLDYEIRPGNTARILLPNGQDIASSKLVYFKAHALYPEHAGAVAQYLKYRHVDFVDQNVESFISRSKISESFILTLSGVPVPPLKILSSGLDGVSYEDLVKYFDETRFILKDAFGDRGKMNFLVSSPDDFAEVSKRMKNVKSIIAQAYIKNDGFTRILLMGSEVVQVVERKTSKHDDHLRSHLNKPQGSENAVEHEPEDFDVAAINLARKAALEMRRNIAGVDLIQDIETGQWYVLEVNYNPQLSSGYGIESKVTGMVKFLKNRG